MPVTFAPPKPPSVRGLRQDREANRIRVVFEGQYSQRARTGPNPIGRTVALSFTRLTAIERDSIDAFLSAREGVEAFLYQVPGDDVQRLWSCAKWSVQPERSKLRWSVRATFIEEFDLT